jgi:hypothetical protein
VAQEAEGCGCLIKGLTGTEKTPAQGKNLKIIPPLVTPVTARKE